MKAVLLSILFSLLCFAQDSKITEFVTSRENFRQNLKNEIFNTLSLPLADSTESLWIKAFWGMELGLVSDDQIQEGLRKAFHEFGERGYEFRRSLLEAVYTLYPDEFYNEVSDLIKIEKDAKLFAMQVNYLIKTDQQTAKYIELLQNKFSGSINPIILALGHQLTGGLYNTAGMPSLVDLFSTAPGNFIIFSLQRSNRDYEGIVLIRTPGGKFLRNNDGNIFSVPQLARSISSLPGFLTNGNTPQGILSIQGFDTSSNVFIGTTTNIQAILPYETSTSTYFHKEVDTDFLQGYSDLLPVSWKDYIPVYEAYFAGKAGRTEIICHGTTVDPEFYKGKAYYPNTPTLGCLSAKEIWSDKDGRNLYSDQKILTDTIISAGFSEGYLIVINIDDKTAPVVINDVIMDILRFEEQEKVF